jgi:hypothetical protein
MTGALRSYSRSHCDRCPHCPQDDFDEADRLQNKADEIADEIDALEG